MGKFDNCILLDDFNLEILSKYLCTFCEPCTTDTGLFHFHRLNVTLLKTYFKKQNSNIIMYRDYQKFSNQIFWDKFVKELSERYVQVDQFDLYQNTALNIINQQAPVKKKHINQSAFFMKKVKKAIMTHSRLVNKLIWKNKGKYADMHEQNNFWVGSVRKAKKDCFSNLNI